MKLIESEWSVSVVKMQESDVAYVQALVAHVETAHVDVQLSAFALPPPALLVSHVMLLLSTRLLPALSPAASTYIHYGWRSISWIEHIPSDARVQLHEA